VGLRGWRCGLWSLRARARLCRSEEEGRKMWLGVYGELWRCACRVVCLGGGLSRVGLGRLVGVSDGMEVVGS